MSKTKIHQLNELGQSVWLDYMSRELIDSGHLKTLIEQGLLGMTSNPTIFDHAISKTSDYDENIRRLKNQGGSTFQIYDELTVSDIQDAADTFRQIYEKSNGLDGYISLEVNPKLANNAQETVKEAKRLCRKVNRQNVMFKVPSTEAGFKAVEELIAEGININITLIFSLAQYIKTAQSYINGLKRRLKGGADIKKVRSVASVFVSRIDTSVDKKLDELIKNEKDEQKKEILKSMKGKAAVANSKIIYAKYMEVFSGTEFIKLAEKGANSQRVLWGSTSTKNPDYSDIKYISELIAKNTVNTSPESTINAFIDHGEVKEGIGADASDAEAVISRLSEFGIDIDDVCKKLLEDGVASFEKSFDSLLASIEEKSKKLSSK